MAADKHLRRMTLRQILTSAEKIARDLIEQMQTGFMVRASDMRDLSRPVRRRSHYPTLLAMQNALRRLTEGGDKIHGVMEELNEHLEAIRDHANRERVNRM